MPIRGVPPLSLRILSLAAFGRSLGGARVWPNRRPGTPVLDWSAPKSQAAVSWSGPSGKGAVSAAAALRKSRRAACGRAPSNQRLALLRRRRCASLAHLLDFVEVDLA